MKLVCVSGGSYKSFYINYFLKLKRCDVLVLNFGIMYNYNIKDELFGKGVVTKELFLLAKRLNCVVVAGVILESVKNKIKAFVACDGEKISLAKQKDGLIVNIKDTTFLLCGNNTQSRQKNKIVLTEKRVYPCLNHCSNNKLYVFCDKFGTTTVYRCKQVRKYNKCNVFYF